MKLIRKISKVTALTAILCLTLSSCKMNEDEQQTTAPAPPTLTESFTEEKSFIPEPPEEELLPKVNLVAYDPFSDVPKPDDTVYQELSEAAEAIEDARGFLYANSTGFYPNSKYLDNYADLDIVLEQDDKLNYTYSPLNSDIATTETELFEYLRSFFTENYITDDEITESLFTPEPYDNQPGYKTIDGVLCIKEHYDSVMTRISRNIAILSYDENTAEIAAWGTSVAYPPNHVFVTLKKSPDGIWQLDKYTIKYYEMIEADALYNAITLNTGKLNEILGGGNTPDDPLTIEVNGDTFVETDLNITIEGMRYFFGTIFDENIMEYVHSDEKGPLLEKYRQKYIDDVYYEQDGILFRKADAPVWYLPDLEIEPYSFEFTPDRPENHTDTEEIKGPYTCSPAGTEGFVWEQPFRDESGESFYYELKIRYKPSEENIINYDSYKFLHIASELPIREKSTLN